MKRVLYLLLLLAPFMQTACIKRMDIEQTPKIGREAFHNQRPGASAGELLRDDRFSSISLEIQYAPGYRPQDETVDQLKKFIHTYVNKPRGIQVILEEIKPMQEKLLSVQQVVGIEKSNRLQYSSGDTIAIYLLFTDGNHIGNKALGMAYKNTSLVIYGKAIRSNSSSSSSLTKAELETAVVLHEMGHLFGLVNDTLADPEHPNHCSNKNCLMYFATDTKSRFKDFLKGKVPSLDAQCIDRLIANGAKALQPKY